MYRHEADRVYLLGYTESEGGWVVIESYHEDDWSVDDQEETIQDWVDEEYGDEFEQGVLDEESKSVAMK